MKQFFSTFAAVLSAILVGYVVITIHQRFLQVEAARKVAVAKTEDTISSLEKTAKEWDEMRLNRTISKSDLVENLISCAEAMRGIANGKDVPRELRDRANLSLAKIEVLIRDAN
jgi:mannitol-specific phosphotransferase system IIBC component